MSTATHPGHSAASSPPLLCIDIGNSRTHYGIVADDGTVTAQGAVATTFIDDPQEGLPSRLPALLQAQPPVGGVSFCSVVPAVNRRLRDVLATTKLPVFQLTHACLLGVPITYPQPAEIGQDRLANAAAVHALGGSPAIVIDSGTAVTFDIVTHQGGYEGGIIAPGLELTRRYLHERTAQLPLLDDSLDIKGMIGKSTAEAMRIGTVIGFPGLIQALLNGVLAELVDRAEPAPRIFITGGNAEFLQSRLRQSVRLELDLTLLGLAATQRLNVR